MVLNKRDVTVLPTPTNVMSLLHTLIVAKLEWYEPSILDVVIINT